VAATASDACVTAHKDAIWALTAAEGVLASASEDCSARLWNAALEPQRTFSAPPSKALAVAVHADYVFVSTHDCNVQVWSRASAELIRTLTGHVWEVWQLRLFHSGGHTWLLSGSFDHTIRVWSLESWACVQILEGHKGYIHALQQASLGAAWPQALVSASGDKSIKVWY
jgi:WD40 repeat protein